MADSGLDTGEPTALSADFASPLPAGGQRLRQAFAWGRPGDWSDPNGHGTHVAGVIAADGAITGVAPGASILAYKTLGSDGQGMMSDVILAIDRAMDPNMDGDTSDRADIISMSLGGQGNPDDPVCIAVRNAVEAGIVTVIAAGNEGPSMGSVASPGLALEAITVGAVNDDGVLASFSSRGMMPDMTIKPEISAPGVSIYSTVPFSGVLGSPTGYLSASGTSMATPHVSGGAALLMQLHPDWTPEQVKSALITSANRIDESVWNAGAGVMWLPGAADTTLFVDPAVVSYGYAGGEDATTTLMNSEGSASLSFSSEDWFALSADGTEQFEAWSNESVVSPTTSTIGSGGLLAVSLSVPTPSSESPEGYYDGSIVVDGSGSTLRIPFGYAVLSRMNVHVLDCDGVEVLDPYGGVWSYRVPDAEVAVMARGNIDPAPPATFLLPSGDYQVFAAGHQDVYHYDDPYLLSSTVHLDRLSSTDVYLRMSDARTMNLDLTTDEGLPIYVKDYRVYFRHEGDRNISFHLVGSDYSIRGPELFSLPSTMKVYVSDTDEEVGISIAGFSYSAPMWDFMEKNYDHWYEYTSGISTDFLIEASADLQYLLSWEFDGVDGLTPTDLSMDDQQCSAFETTYDIPGTIGTIWGDWGSHKSIGGDAAFYVRRDTDTSLNSFFSGMSRTTFVQGVFSELYFTQSVLDGYFERVFYSADYDNLIRAQTASSIYIPDRHFLEANDAFSTSQNLGAGPYYPSVYTDISDDVLRVFHPLLMDQSGAKVGGGTVPSLNLYKNSQFAGIYQISEYLSRPDAVREISLMGDGQYTAKIHYQPMTMICADVDIELSFTVPSADSNPPVITSMTMPQRYVPGDVIDIVLSATDLSSSLVTNISWREGGSGEWMDLSVVELSPGTYSTSIQTTSTDDSIDLLVEVMDEWGNSIRYTATSASMAQVPVIFELSAQDKDIGYRSGDDSITISGTLTDAAGNPLHSSGAVPLELIVDERKVGMILDDYVTYGSHVHNGEIRFDWHFDPASLFTGPDETVEVSVTFDLGLYEPMTQTFEMHSVEYESTPPSIELVSPVPGDIILPGTAIDLEITDVGSVTVECYLDGVSIGEINDPWDVTTDSWEDGEHTLRVVATDELMDEAEAVFSFTIDGTEPEVTIAYPSNGSTIPRDGTMTVEVEDEHDTYVTWMVDDGPWEGLASPYLVNMTGWDYGVHDVTVLATDVVGLTGSASVQFQIIDGSIAVNFVNVFDGDVIKSGTEIEFLALGDGLIECAWAVDGVWHDAQGQWTISSDGWAEGVHVITVNATNNLGDSHENSMTISIDDTAPTISLVSPSYGSFLGPDDFVVVEADDDHFSTVTWSVWGETRESTDPEVNISLADAPSDGYFTVSVTAVDTAGNSAIDHFAFAMDSVPPTITVANLYSGQSIAPGYTILVDVDDAFLTSVIWSLDDASGMELSAPYEIDSGAMALGWHDLAVIATDTLGQSNWSYRSFYVDGIAPIISIDIEDSYDPDEPFEVRADVEDDFAVSSITLHYETADGVFASVIMSEFNRTYVAVLEPDMLMSGMTMFITADDMAGNSAESEHRVIEALASEHDSPAEDATPTDDPDTRLNTMMIGLGVFVGIILLVVMVVRKKRAPVSREPPPRRRPTATKQNQAKRPAAKPRPTPPAPRKVYCKPIRVPEGRVVRRVHHPGETAPRFYMQKDNSWILVGAEDGIRVHQAQGETSWERR